MSISPRTTTARLFPAVDVHGVVVDGGDGVDRHEHFLLTDTEKADVLVHGGRPVSSDRLVHDLRGEQPPGNPTNTPQTKVSQLRRALGPDGRDQVVFQPAGHVLRTDEIDALSFARLLDRARETVPWSAPPGWSP